MVSEGLLVVLSALEITNTFPLPGDYNSRRDLGVGLWGYLLREVGTKRPRYFLNYFINNRGLLFYQLERYCKHLMRKESPYVLEDLDPEEAARRARAREVYEKMYPLSTDDPYGEKRLERVQTPAGVKRAFNQVAREMGLGGLVDAPDAEQTRKLEVREIDRNAYRQPSARERCPRESRSRRRPGWVVAHFVLPRPIIEGLGVLAKACCEMVLPCECRQRRANE
jgi:hypothetical protein